MPKINIFSGGYYNMIADRKFLDSPLTIISGIANNNRIYTDMETAPHLLVAGTPSSGKSVFIDSILCQLLLKHSPNSLYLFIIDPKKVDYMEYRNLPHCKQYATGKAEIISLLQTVNNLMYSRYNRLEKMGIKKGTIENGFPACFVIFDEYASIKDKTVSNLIQNIAQLGRAANIHLLIATQRPDRDSINGTIKANIPCRITFRLRSKIDYRIILDMAPPVLLKNPGDGFLIDQCGNDSLFHSPMVNQEEKEQLLRFWKNQV